MSSVDGAMETHARLRLLEADFRALARAVAQDAELEVVIDPPAGSLWFIELDTVHADEGDVRSSPWMIRGG